MSGRCLEKPTACRRNGSLSTVSTIRQCCETQLWDKVSTNHHQQNHITTPLPKSSTPFIGYHSMEIRGDGINGLPTELLCNIFRLVIDQNTPQRDRCRLTLVCHRWRECVEGSALLWVDISALDGLTYVRRALERSKGVMINLHCPERMGLNLEWFLAEASLYVARWQSVDVKIRSSPLSWEFALAPLITMQPPGLETLKLVVPYAGRSESKIALFGGAPAPTTLRHLTLNGIPVAFEPLSLSGLISLDLKHVPTISTPQLLEILRYSPWLETLSLYENPRLEGIGGRPSTIQAIELPKLVSLSFKWTDHGATNCILSNIRIPNRRHVLIYGTVTGNSATSILFTPAITHVLHTTIPIADLPSSTISVEIDEDDDCRIKFRGIELSLLVDGEDQIEEMLGWLADGLGAEAAKYPVHLIIDQSEMDPIRLTALPPPLVVKHLSISESGRSGVFSASICGALARSPDPTSPGWLLAQMESLSVKFRTLEPQKQLTAMLRSRYEGESLTGDTELRCPMSLRSVELRGRPRAEGLVEEIRGILGEVNVFWAD